MGPRTHTHNHTIYGKTIKAVCERENLAPSLSLLPHLQGFKSAKQIDFESFFLSSSSCTPIALVSIVFALLILHVQIALPVKTFFSLLNLSREKLQKTAGKFWIFVKY